MTGKVRQRIVALVEYTVLDVDAVVVHVMAVVHDMDQQEELNWLVSLYECKNVNEELVDMIADHIDMNAFVVVAVVEEEDEKVGSLASWFVRKLLVA